MCKINKSPRIGNRPDYQNYRKIVALPFIAGIDKKSWYCQILAKLRSLRPPPEFTNLAPGARYQWLPPLVVVGLIINDFPKIVKNDCIGIVSHRSDYYDCKSFLLIY